VAMLTISRDVGRVDAVPDADYEVLLAEPASA